MLSVGIRELKNRLSEFVRGAEAGERVLVTDRGKVVAELREPGSAHEAALPSGLATLARQGHLTLASQENARYPKLRRLRRVSQSQQLIDAERAERPTS